MSRRVSESRAGYIAATTIIAALYFFAVLFLHLYIEDRDISVWVYLPLLLLMATTLHPAIELAKRLIDKVFYKDRYDYRQIIQSLNISLNSVNSLTDVSRLVVGTTCNTLNLAGGCLFIKGQSGSLDPVAVLGSYAGEVKQERLHELISLEDRSIEFPNSAARVDPEVAFLIRLTVAKEVVGVLCLSPRVSRQSYSVDDIYLLEGIAAVATMALHRAMLVRDVSQRDTFVSVASHELRTPLTSIIGYTELLLQKNPPEDTRIRWLNAIFESSQRVSGIVDDLLNVSRIQSGRVNMKTEPTKLMDVLKDILAAGTQSSDKHQFITQIESDLPDVLVDRYKFAQVMGNLLSNAVKFSPAGGRITIAARYDSQRRRVVVSITDEGIGIGPEDKDHLFKTFHRIQRTETLGIRGSGLGLYIAKEWTEAMGGKIWLESVLNKGSTFFVAVPTAAPIAATGKET